MMSVAVPAPVGTISLIGRVGQRCAQLCACAWTSKRRRRAHAKISAQAPVPCVPRAMFSPCLRSPTAMYRRAAHQRKETSRARCSFISSAAFRSIPRRRCSRPSARRSASISFSMPDGEVGPRRHWISRVHYQVLAAHPELEIVQRPAPDENGVERQFPRNAGDAWRFKVKAGVKQVRFGDPGWRLGYARDALNSYFVFRVMKERGVLPQHLRFQVSIPMVNSVLPPRIFPDQDDLAKIRPGYAAATRAEIAHDHRQDSQRRAGDAVGLLDRAAGRLRRHPGLIRSRARSSATSTRCAALSPRDPGRRSRSAITSASARSAAGRALRPTISARRCSSPTRSSPPPAGGSTGSTCRCSTAATMRSSPRSRELEPQGARVYLGAIHNMEHVRAAPRRRAQISAGVRPRRLLRLRPPAAVRAAGRAGRSPQGGRAGDGVSTSARTVAILPVGGALAATGVAREPTQSLSA